MWMALVPMVPDRLPSIPDHFGRPIHWPRRYIGSAYFNGQIDDVRLYGAELNATLIGQLYGNGNGDFNRLTVKTAGTVTITATQPGNNSYAQAPSSSITATFDKSDQTISFYAHP